MRLVIEGISAAGKTTWCQGMAPGRVIAEGPGSVVDVQEGCSGAARHWTRVNGRRRAEALRIEARHGLSVCDTDPLKLHYVWSLRRIGESQRRAARCPATTTGTVRRGLRQSIAQQHFGDHGRYPVARDGPPRALILARFASTG